MDNENLILATFFHAGKMMQINKKDNSVLGGGTRMRKGLNKHEVVSLAKTMEVKFTGDILHNSKIN